MKTHFKGDWFIDKGNSPAETLIRSRYNDENYDIASFKCDDTGKIEQNAALMVCAPELLENLKNIIWNFGNYSAFNESQKAAIKYANELIQKIEK